jgi:hypothetical protein
MKNKIRQYKGNDVMILEIRLMINYGYIQEAEGMTARLLRLRPHLRSGYGSGLYSLIENCPLRLLCVSFFMEMSKTQPKTQTLSHCCSQTWK